MIKNLIVIPLRHQLFGGPTAIRGVADQLSAHEMSRSPERAKPDHPREVNKKPPRKAALRLPVPSNQN